MQKVIILGGIGNGSVIAQAIEDANRRGDMSCTMCGYLNDREFRGSEIDGYPVLGSLSEASIFAKQGYRFINTIYRIDGAEERLDMFERLGLSEDKLAVFIHPTAYIAPNAVIESGSVVMPLVMISAGATIGKCSILMIGCSIGHNTVLGHYCHVAAQAVVGAFNSIGRGVHIGLNATTLENLVLKDYSTVGMGAVIHKNVGEKEVWAGNPARLLRMAD